MKRVVSCTVMSHELLYVIIPVMTVTLSNHNIFGPGVTCCPWVDREVFSVAYQRYRIELYTTKYAM